MENKVLVHSSAVAWDSPQKERETQTLGWIWLQGTAQRVLEAGIALAWLLHCILRTSRGCCLAYSITMHVWIFDVEIFIQLKDE